MLIENTFTVPLPVEQLWAFLLDVERVAPCMPGAELTETIDDRSWKGKVNVKFGLVSLSFAGTVTMDERDDAAHRVVLAAKGMEKSGKGAATAKVTGSIEPGSEGSVVTMQADITLSGTVAQLSRGLLPEISKKLTKEFADCLQSAMGAAGGDDSGNPGPASSSGDPVVAPPAVSKPVGGIGLGLSAIWALIRNFFAKLFRRSR